MRRQWLRIVTWVACVILLVVICFIYGLQQFGLLRPAPWSVAGEDVPIVSTRGHLRNGELTPGHNSYDYATIGEIPGIAPGTEAPDDLLIIVHGFNNTPEMATRVFALAYESLESCGFRGAVVGFSWDADTQVDPLAMMGFHEGRRHTASNGPKLARFVADYKARCPDTRVHIMGYSVGTRLALEVVLALDQDPAFADNPCKVDSVHLVGASVDNEEVQTDQKYGLAIENRAVVLVNYYSKEDNILSVLYRIKEGDAALGQADIQNINMKPRNYVSTDIEDELMTFDAEGNPQDEQLGDNHLGCLGYRDDDGNLIDDGVMDVVAEAIHVQAMLTDR